MYVNGEWVDYMPGGAGMNNDTGYGGALGGASPVNPATGYASYQGGSEYQRYLASGGKASEQEYINYNYGGGGGGLTQGGGAPSGGSSAGGFSPGVSYVGQGGGGGGGGNPLLGAAAGAAAGGLGSIALGGLGSTAPLMAFGPAGMAVAGGLLGASLLGGMFGGESNKEFEGTRLTGGAEAWQERGGVLAGHQEAIPTLEEFTTQGRWLLPQDTYAHDYGRTGLEAQYYENFRQTAQSALDAGDMGTYQATLRGHGFDAGGAPAPAAAAGPSRRSAPAPTTPSAPAPTTPTNKNEISEPGDGLEGTIKRAPPPSYMYPERVRRSYLGLGSPKDEDNSPSSYLTRAG